MAKGTYLKKYAATIKGLVLKEYLHSHRKALAKEILLAVNEKLKSKRIRDVSLSYVNTILAELRRKDRAGDLTRPEDNPFSIGGSSRPEFFHYFTPESISKIVKFQKKHQEEWYLTEEELASIAEDEKGQFETQDGEPRVTIRLAKWFVRMLPIVEEMFTNEALKEYRASMLKYAIADDPQGADWPATIESEPRDEIICDYAFNIGEIYAENEKISEMVGEEYFDTRDLDKDFYGDRPFDVDYFDNLSLKHWKRIFSAKERLEQRNQRKARQKK